MLILRLIRITRDANSCAIVYAGIGNLVAVVLFPVLMYTFRLGATGAALSTVVSQYVLFLFFLALHIPSDIIVGTLHDI